MAGVNSAVILGGESSMPWVQVIGWVAVAAGALLAAQSVGGLSDAAWLGWLRRLMPARVGRRRARQSLYSALVTVAVGLAAVSAGGQGAVWLAVVIAVIAAVALSLRVRPS